LKKKIAEYEAKSLVDEDPEELTLYNTDGEEITVDECKAREVRKAKEAREARLEAKRRTTLPLACLNRSRDVRRLPFIVIFMYSLYCLTLVGMVVPFTFVILSNL
jgi:hypothetical protein